VFVVICVSGRLVATEVLQNYIFLLYRWQKSRKIYRRRKKNSAGVNFMKKILPMELKNEPRGRRLATIKPLGFSGHYKADCHPVGPTFDDNGKNEKIYAL
jgi:hypothetical protein